ncbi:hypothetical protein P175DRAFT_0530057 [Aspergillus ochraceoroseus IBT 24754]|uniref:Uncharacterized protein n=1 Tax=Aspergillus ochraceoroseus IBT 24754 TaxID=1392256 RepID=A0A2T5M354_9EURO|nr:uncharacterized protein P175DRAFT_0530057 [Aspergillus ochraceoroseus IBT 24754]PTU22970.1 hypothetical protein P175DRAFT_0530057 [Aspergillus ochraceoroseus IBT 24754]
MGQRHNRRRTRPRSRNRNTTTLPALPSTFDCPESHLVSSRHYRWSTWQERELLRRPESTMLETEQYRLFGGEPGDDVALCYRMLEYFGGLDYIDPSSAQWRRQKPAAALLAAWVEFVSDSFYVT